MNSLGKRILRLKCRLLLGKDGSGSHQNCGYGSFFLIDGGVVFIREHPFPFSGNVGCLWIGAAHVFYVESSPSPRGCSNGVMRVVSFRRGVIIVRSLRAMSQFSRIFLEDFFNVFVRT